jgi:sarcosine oxidase subunit alpha
VSKAKADFLGKRGLQQPAVRAAGRKQLVGLLTADPAEVLEEGAQVVAMPEPGQPPVPMIGHVTSSYLSPNVGRSIAMAMVRGGHGLHGRTVYVPMPGRVIAAQVTRPVFFDPEGARLDG